MTYCNQMKYRDQDFSKREMYKLLKSYEWGKMYQRGFGFDSLFDENINKISSLRDHKLRMYLNDARCCREKQWIKSRGGEDEMMRLVFFSEEKQRLKFLEKEAMYNQIMSDEIYEDTPEVNDEELIFVEEMELLENDQLDYLIEKYMEQ